MRSPIDDEIRQIFDQGCGIDEGEVATYIPELADADPTVHELCVMSVEGHNYADGAVDVPFTIQSISKVFAYALALETYGFEAVDELFDVEPSGEAFKQLSLDSRTHRPRNPMINAGAITGCRGRTRSSDDHPLPTGRRRQQVEGQTAVGPLVVAGDRQPQLGQLAHQPATRAPSAPGDTGRPALVRRRRSLGADRMLAEARHATGKVVP